MNLTRKTVLVTGANRGLGKALVDALLATNVACNYAAARSPASVQAADARVKPVALDVTDSAAVARLAADIPELDLLINNAGAIEFGDAFSTTEEHLERCLDINLKGVWRVSQAFAPHLVASQGAICNVLSVLSLASMPGLAAYNLSKAAAWSLTLSLRGSLLNKNVSVHSVFPGAIDTDMIAGVEIEKASPAEVARDIVTGIAEGDEDIFPATLSKQAYAKWRQDHKALEREFAQI